MARMPDSQCGADGEPAPAQNPAPSAPPLLSVVIAVRDPDRAAPLLTLYRDYAQQLETLQWPYEFVFAVEGTEPSVLAPLRRLRDRGEPGGGPRGYGGCRCVRAFALGGLVPDWWDGSGGPGAL